MEQTPKHDGAAKPGSKDSDVESGSPGDVPHTPPAQTEAGHEQAARPKLGAEAIPKQAQHHTTEHESGYGGKGAQPRVSSDQRPGT